MCGIAGFIDFSKKSNKEVLVKMTDELAHRGEDDSGYKIYENENFIVGFGHRRLSIIDLSSLGAQPMSFDKYEIVFNGEIYNFVQIKEELESLGYVFISHSDTEVILKAYHKWGIKAADKFIGMFVIAIYDKAEQKIIFVRDRAGVKPLYYYFKDNLFLFASELKSFHKHNEFAKNINLDALLLFFEYGYILEPYSIFENTFKLKAGHYGILDLKSKDFSTYKYWSVIECYNAPKLDISFNEAKDELKGILKKAFEYRMVADVPVGMFLSGGYDSSAVSAILQSERSSKLKTFSIGFEQAEYNEAPFAKQTAQFLGTDHTEYYCTQKDAIAILPQIPYIWDEPFGDSSAIPTAIVARLAKKQVKVSLSADGGDEIFGGYAQYARIAQYQKIAKLLKIPFKDLIFSSFDRLIYSFCRNSKILHRYEKAKTLLRINCDADLLRSMVYQYSPNIANELLYNKAKEPKTAFDDAGLINTDIVSKEMCVEYKGYQLDDILVKVDRATMSIGLESREPFLDQNIIEFVARLPLEYKINNGIQKYILKSIVHDYIPKNMLDRPKQGFAVPLAQWFGDELKKYILEYLSPENLAKMSDILNPKVVEKIKAQWLEGNGAHSATKIWYLLVFAMWHKRWMREG